MSHMVRYGSCATKRASVIELTIFGQNNQLDTKIDMNKHN